MGAGLHLGPHHFLPPSHLELWRVPRMDEALVGADRLVGPLSRLQGVLCVKTDPAHFAVVQKSSDWWVSMSCTFFLLPPIPDDTARHVKGEVRSE